MSLNPHISRRRRALSPEIKPIAKIGTRNSFLSFQQSTLKRTLSDSSSSSLSPLPIIQKMASSGGSGGTGGASSQPLTSSVIGSFYSHQVPVQSTTNPTKVIKKYVLFQFEEDATTTPWNVSSPLNLALTTHPLHKFKENLPWFSWNNCWVCVIFFACVCVWVRQIRQLRLTIPSPRALPCASGAFLGGSQGGAGMPPPGYTQRSAPGGSPGSMGFGAMP
jgi:hypothetical protein